MDQGLTGDPLLFWSGDTLIDLIRYQALKIWRLSSSRPPFIELGGFGVANPRGWQSPLVVMKKKP